MYSIYMRPFYFYGTILLGISHALRTAPDQIVDILCNYNRVND